MTVLRAVRRGALPEGYFDGARDRILALQRDSGAIPWFDEGVLDPWNHTEAAMGLTVVGEIPAARRAFAWLRQSQLPDGSWWGELGSAAALDGAGQSYAPPGAAPACPPPIRDTNFAAYAATGAWHHYLATRDRAFLKQMWPHVDAAMEFVLGLQSLHGDIRWAPGDERAPEDDALVAGCCSIHKSLECALEIAAVIGEPRPAWRRGRQRLGRALREHPERFDRTWESKARYSMDWYYPVLAGVLTGAAARRRIASKWTRFVIPGRGCRCVVEEPWVTVAESAELAMALLACGARPAAEQMFAWQHLHRDETGAYWMGWQAEAGAPWPAEKPAWTAAAVILAADALLELSPAARVFAPSGRRQAAE